MNALSIDLAIATPAETVRAITPTLHAEKAMCDVYSPVGPVDPAWGRTAEVGVR